MALWHLSSNILQVLEQETTDDDIQSLPLWVLKTVYLFCLLLTVNVECRMFSVMCHLEEDLVMNGGSDVYVAFLIHYHRFEKTRAA